MGVKVKGLKQAKANFDHLIDDVVGKKAVRATYRILFIIGTQASIYTPIDTSTLINSQFREVKVGNKIITGRVGYSANYAVYVHDPNVKQNFRRSTAKKEFLKLGADDSKGQIDMAVAEEMSL